MSIMGFALFSMFFKIAIPLAVIGLFMRLVIGSTNEISRL